ncbi:MAG TPA: DUF4352 domain-containing protein [Abditibacteriaceae bacterium]
MICKTLHPHLWLGLLAATSLAAPASFVYAAPAQNPKPKTTKPVTKPRAKPQPQTSTVLGMVPMAGVEGKIAQTYTIGTEQPINFTLHSAEYTLERVNVDANVVAPNADEKLLLLRYSVHNPNKSERQYYWGTLSFTAVDAMNQNRESEGRVGAPDTGEALNIALKPAQKVEAYTVIKVPAKGVVPKLIVKPENGGVIRYDLRGVAKPLAAPFADSSDKTGATALAEIPAQAGQYYPLQNFDIKVLETGYADALGETVPGDDQRFFVATISMRNATKDEKRFYWGTFKATLTDADGEAAEWPQTLFKATRNEPADGTLKPGQEYKARVYFALPKNVAAKTLTLAEEESHSYAFDVSAAK